MYANTRQKSSSSSSSRVVERERREKLVGDTVCVCFSAPAADWECWRKEDTFHCTQYKSYDIPLRRLGSPGYVRWTRMEVLISLLLKTLRPNLPLPATLKFQGLLFI